jgi:hypothetical protein
MWWFFVGNVTDRFGMDHGGLFPFRNLLGCEVRGGIRCYTENEEMIHKVGSATCDYNEITTVGVSESHKEIGFQIINPVHDQIVIRCTHCENEGSEFLISEFNSLICNIFDGDFVDMGNETRFLDNIIPSSVIIEILNARIYIDQIAIDKFASKESGSQIAELKNQYKEVLESETIAKINQYIQQNEKSWIAGSTLFSRLSYQEKKSYFGDTLPYLAGMEYYRSGYFPYGFDGDYAHITVNQDIVEEFDWRNRHQSNDISSPYHMQPDAKNSVLQITDNKGAFILTTMLSGNLWDMRTVASGLKLNIL